MFRWQLKGRIRRIVRAATELKNGYTSEKDAPVNYACIFSHGDREFQKLKSVSRRIGSLIEETPTGPLFHINPMSTAAGTLRVLKIRAPDGSRPEWGDADFTVTDYTAFKARHIEKPGFKLIERDDYEMIELTNNTFHVRAYFSNPPIDKQLGLV